TARISGTGGGSEDPPLRYRDRQRDRGGSIHLEPADTLADQIEFEQVITRLRRREGELHRAQLSGRRRAVERNAGEVDRQRPAVPRAQVNAEVHSAMCG